MLRKLLLASILGCMVGAPVSNSAPVAPVENIPVKDVTVYESTVKAPEQITVSDGIIMYESPLTGEVNKESACVAPADDMSWMRPAEDLENGAVVEVSECFAK